MLLLVLTAMSYVLGARSSWARRVLRPTMTGARETLEGQTRSPHFVQGRVHPTRWRVPNIALIVGVDARRSLLDPIGVLRGSWLAASASLLTITLIGGLLRLVPVLVADFPINDGGLFLTMAEDLRANAFTLPRYATYNDLQIPYAYPPLGFYLTALITSLAGISGTDVLRFLPALVSVATIPFAYAIGREVFRHERMALATAAFFACSPGSYEWLIGGGGIARAPAFLLALVAVLVALRMHSPPTRWKPFLAGTALGASALWHPEAGIFGAVSVVVTAPFMTADRWAALRRVALLAATAFVIVLPWFIAILAMHGPQPVLSARASGGSLLDGLLVLAASGTSGGRFEILGMATSFGLVVSAIRRSWLIPVWMVAIALSDPRAGAMYASVPAAMAVAFLVRDIGSVVSKAGGGDDRGPRRMRQARMATGVAFAVLAIGVGVDTVTSRLNPLSPTHVLSALERQGMKWAANQTDPDSSFVVVSGSPWFVDAEAEWFPVLANRLSIATVQGYEWLEGDAFRVQHERADLLLRCAAASDGPCIERWLDDAGGADYLYLTRSPALASMGVECCLQLASVLSGAEVAYRNEAVVIVKLER